SRTSPVRGGRAMRCSVFFSGSMRKNALPPGAQQRQGGARLCSHFSCRTFKSSTLRASVNEASSWTVGLGHFGSSTVLGTSTVLGGSVFLGPSFVLGVSFFLGA